MPAGIMKLAMLAMYQVEAFEDSGVFKVSLCAGVIGETFRFVIV